MNAPLKRRLTVSEFLDWALVQPKARYELVDGQVVSLAPERALHVVLKVAVVRTLQDAIAAAALPCVVFGDGLTVRIDENNAREPDALVQCGRPFDPDTLLADEPMVVVEVISPSSIQTDNVDKLRDYFSIPAIQHYLIVDPTAKTVTHHERADGNRISTRILRQGSIKLVPPGVDVSVEAIFASIPT
jgi:Uma2 family endonuclease